jgi:Domain of unknown function (DUF1707)/Domain of unknown function (DUF4190)
MAVDPMFAGRFAGPLGVRAANADRERAIDVLKAGFAEGRLTKAEYDDRAARVYASRTYGELGPLIADLPAGPLGGPLIGSPPYPVAWYQPRSPLNSTAVASLTCGIAVFPTMGLTGIPAIVLGHRARREMRTAGQRGDGLALAGMILGWIGVALTAVFIVGLLAVSAIGHTARPVITTPDIVKPMPAQQAPVKPGPPAGNPGGMMKVIVVSG